MPGLQTPAVLAALKTRLYKDFSEAMSGAPVFSDRLGFYTSVSSDTESNTYDWLAAVTGMREWVGPRVIDGMRERVFQIVNKHYERTLEVNRDQLEDSPMSAVGNAAARLNILLEAGRKLQDDLLIGLINAGGSALCYDGQFFFDTDHPTDLDAAGTQSNLQAAAFALTAANFQTARANMMSFKGENGRPLGVNPNLLAVPPALEKAANDIVTAEFGSSGASNMHKGMARVEVVPELAGADTTWYLFDTVSPGAKPFILQNRKPLQLVQRMGESDDPVFSRNVIQFGLDARMGAGYGVWSRAYKAVG